MNDTRIINPRIRELEEGLREIDKLAYNHVKGAIGKAQQVARRLLRQQQERDYDTLVANHPAEYAEMNKAMQHERPTAEQSSVAQPVKFGCHCDLEPGEHPSECCLDIRDIAGCLYLLRGEVKEKEQCKWWKPVEQHPPAPAGAAATVPKEAGWYWRKFPMCWAPMWVHEHNGELSWDGEDESGAEVEDDGRWGGPCLGAPKDGRDA